MYLEDYLKNPTRVSSLAYWKSKNYILPRNIEVFHSDEYFGDYKNAEKYFRLIHNLRNIKPIDSMENHIVENINLHDEKHIEQLYYIINNSYEDIKVSKENILSWTKTPAFNSELYIFIKDLKKNEYIASGIAEYDDEAKEGVLDWIQVLPQYQGKGLGQLIVSELLLRLKVIGADFVTVSGKVDNKTNPQKLYRKCGFMGNDIWVIVNKET